MTLFDVILEIILALLLTSLFVPLPFTDQGTVRYNTFPWMTLSLIAINTLVFALWQAPHIVKMINAINLTELQEANFAYREIVWTYGFRPSFLRDGISIGAFTTFTSTFMHSDFNHLTINMIFLWAFGRRIEDACGPWRYLIFYLFAGMIASLGFAVLAFNEADVPSIGASGAIAGVMGAYMLLFPAARMSCLWGIVTGWRVLSTGLRTLFGSGNAQMRWLVNIRAWIVLLFYMGFDILDTFETAETGQLLRGVNYVAHACGFLSAITIFLFVRKDLVTRYFAGRAV